MGKRKRCSDQNLTDPPRSSSGAVPFSSEMELLAEEKLLHSVHSSETKPCSSLMNAVDGSKKLPFVTPEHQEQSVGHSIFTKRPRYLYGHHYSRRGSSNHSNASTSRGKGFPALRDKRLSFMLAKHCNTEYTYYPESRERTIYMPERITANSMFLDELSSNMLKVVCGVCQKLLRRKAHFDGSRHITPEPPSVAVLVCGHVYHTDCLEESISFEDRHDPPCPLCSGSVSGINDSRRRE